MTETQIVADVPEDGSGRVHRSAWRTIIGSVEGKIGLGFALVMIGTIALGRFFAPYSPTGLAVGPRLSGPSIAHLLGTDGLGRDVLSRFLLGGDTILLVPFFSVGIAAIVGGTLGVISAYKGETFDLVFTRIIDLFLTLPPLLIVLVLIGSLGTSKIVLISVVALVFIPRVARVFRGAAQAVITRDYIAAAQARGERTLAIVFREVVPNIVGPATADLALRLTYAIMFVAALNFLGLGAQPPTPDWGLMVADSRGILAVQPWAGIAPAMGIAALSISFNLVADAYTRHVTRDTIRGGVPL